jgi:hypothetical protein
MGSPLVTFAVWMIPIYWKLIVTFINEGANRLFMSRSSDQSEVIDESEQQGDGPDTTRRRLLATGAATWASVAVAGCPGDGGDGETSPTGTDTPTDEPTDTATDTPEPQPENYVVTAETWAGGSGVPASISFMSACATTNTFVPGMQVVFFVGVYDPETGDKLTNDDLDGAQINLGDGMETVSLSWSEDHAHATQGDTNWVGSWTLPEDMEPQDLSYTVEVSGGGDANFQNVGVLTDNIAIVAYDDPANLVVDTETRWNGHPAPDYTNGFVGACAPERQYSSDMDVTFVIGVYDSTNGQLVGADGLYQESATLPEEGNPDSLLVEDETSPYNDGIDSVTVVSPDGAFDDIELEWTSAADDENGKPRWFGTLETENLDAGGYTYEVQVTDEGSNSFNTGIASDQFTIVEIPE